jgi:ribosomal protein S18 acetylase RimI-like enzyme
MKREVTFRVATISDAITIARIGAETFKVAFGLDNTPEDMEEYLAANFSRDVIRDLLAEASSTFLLGYEGGKVIGYAMLRKGAPPSSVMGSSPIELVRFYVVEGFLGLGYGSELMRACLAKAQEMGHATIWLGVWEKNDRAVRFYEKWGFRKVGTKRFILGRDVQRDFIMQRSG